MITKPLTSDLYLKGIKVGYADCTRLIPEMDTVVCNLISDDESQETIETDAVFFYQGDRKDAPFTLTEREIEILTDSEVIS